MPVPVNQIVAVGAQPALPQDYRFCTTGASITIYGNLYDGSGRTIGTFSGTLSTTVVSWAYSTDASDWLTLNGTFLKQPDGSYYTVKDVIGFDLPASLASQIKFATDAYVATPAAALRSILGDVVGLGYIATY